MRSPSFAELAPKTVLTRSQLQTLMSEPQIPELRPTPEMAARLRVVDYADYLAFAPGMALIKAPGHTPGLPDGLCGPAVRQGGAAGWRRGLAHGRRAHESGKDAPWIKEPPELMAAELGWLNGLSRTEKNLSMSSATMRNNVANISSKACSATDSSDPSPSGLD